MPVTIPERRRSARVPIGPGSWLTVPSTSAVELVDLSLGGVAFTSPHRLEQGRKVTVRTTLGRDGFSGRVQVCWSRRLGAGIARPAQFEVGARFLALDESSDRALRSILKVNPVREQA